MTDVAERQSAIDLRAWISSAIRLALFPVAFLWPAGDWTWWEGWAVVGLYFGYAIAMTAFLSKTDPELLRERMRGSPTQADQKRWDQVLSVLMFLAGFAMFIVPGLDVVRYGWTASLPTWLEVAAMAIHIPCFVLIAWVMRENTYLSRVVKIDEARGHSVITTGPYAIVRHPMYVAVITMVLAMPLALGSRWGMVPAAVMAGLLILRTALEDRTLHAELDGYRQYAIETPYRLLPGLW